MNKKFYSLVAVIALSSLSLVSACGSATEPIKAAKGVTPVLATVVDTAVAPVTNLTPSYLVTFEVRQNHFTLDIGKHVSDATNKTTFQVPVDKRFYDAVSVGSVINDDFRLGSLVMRGSIGNWKITVKDKQVV